MNYLKAILLTALLWLPITVFAATAVPWTFTNSTDGFITPQKVSNVNQAIHVTTSTGTSTFSGPVQISNNNLTTTPSLFVGTSTAGYPLYGLVQGDVIDGESDFNGTAAFNIANANSGSCASSGFFGDGNIVALSSDYSFFGFTNAGWTGSGCAFGNALERPESTVIANPTGDMDLELASTSPVFYNFYGGTKKVLSISANTGSTTVGGGTAGAGLTILGGATTTLVGSTTFSVLNSGTSTKPVALFQILASTTNAETGLQLTSKSSGNGLYIDTNSWATNDLLEIRSKGTGNLNLGTPGAGIINICANLLSSGNCSFNNLQVAAQKTSISSNSLLGSTGVFGVSTANSRSGNIASTEAPMVSFLLANTAGSTDSWSVNANGVTGVPLQRNFVISAPMALTFAASSTANKTFTDAASFGVDAPPYVGTNAKITNSYAILVGSSTAPSNTMYNSSTTNAYGIGVWVPSGAQNTYAATFNGNVTIGTTTSLANFTATNVNANATTSIQFGKPGQNKGTCTTFYDTAGSPVYMFFAAGASSPTYQNGGTAPSGCAN